MRAYASSPIDRVPEFHESSARFRSPRRAPAPREAAADANDDASNLTGANLADPEGLGKLVDPSA
jgi:hypothetical protein